MNPTKAKAYLMNINSIADWLSGRVAALILMILSLERRRNFRVMESCQQFRWRRINL